MNIRGMLVGLLTKGSRRLGPAASCHAEYHFAQFGEDIIVSAHFPPRYRGVFVDVGAHDPFRFSNTALFSMRGWRGLTVEPNPEVVDLFRRARPLDTHLCMGVASTMGRCRYQMYRDPALNRFATDEERPAESDGVEVVSELEVEVRTLEQILRGQFGDRPKIDFLSIDAEGMDLEILQSNDWDRCRPNIICVEDCDPPQCSSTVRFLESQQYDLVGMTHPSRIFRSRTFEIEG